VNVSHQLSSRELVLVYVSVNRLGCWPSNCGWADFSIADFEVDKMLGWSGVLMQLTLLIVTIFTSVVYLSSSWLRKLFTWIRPWRWHIRTLERQLQNALSYDEWHQVALELDEVEQKSLWKLDPNGQGLYDQDRLNERLFRLREARTDSDISTALLQLRENLFRNIAGLGKPELYSHCHVGTKVIVDQYLQQIVSTIDHIASSPQLSISEKERYLSDARQAYGRSALLLVSHLSRSLIHFEPHISVVDSPACLVVWPNTRIPLIISALIRLLSVGRCFTWNDALGCRRELVQAWAAAPCHLWQLIWRAFCRLAW
jgi:hypothetical protein